MVTHTNNRRNTMFDPEQFGAGLAELMFEALVPLKKEIEELKKRVKELEETEG